MPDRLKRESGVNPELPRSGKRKRNASNALGRCTWEAKQSRRAIGSRLQSPKTCQHTGPGPVTSVTTLWPMPNMLSGAGDRFRGEEHRSQNTRHTCIRRDASHERPAQGPARGSRSLSQELSRLLFFLEPCGGSTLDITPCNRSTFPCARPLFEKTPLRLYLPHAAMLKYRSLAPSKASSNAMVVSSPIRQKN